MNKQKTKHIGVLIPLLIGLCCTALLMLLTVLYGQYLGTDAVYTAATPSEVPPRSLSEMPTTVIQTETETETEEPTETETDTTDTVDTDESGSDTIQVFPTPDKKIELEAISQLPDLPNGCEAVSLTTVLRFYGYTVTKGTIVDYYLPRGELAASNPFEVYVGNPYEAKGGYGCCSPVICETARKFLRTNPNGTRLKVLDLTGKPFSDLCDYVRRDIPVIVWATLGMTDLEWLIATWEYEGHTYSWYRYSHCLVLVGYNDGYYWFADPMLGSIVNYPKAAVEKAYDLLGKQAVVLIPSGK